MTEHVLYGTDGFRDIATDEPGPGKMNTETAEVLAFAVVDHQNEEEVSGAVVFGRDTRPSGEALQRAAMDGALEAGAQVLDLGVVPTPALQKVCGYLDAKAGFMMSASHNPWPDNGYKYFLGNRKPWGNEAAAISDRYWGLVKSGLHISRSRRDQTIATHEFGDWYTNQVVENVYQTYGDRPLEGKLFLVDGACGSASLYTPRVLKMLGATVEEFACDTEGYINDGCGAADLSGVKRYLQEHPEIAEHPQFVGAIANDGDGDRMRAVGVSWYGGRPQIVELNGNHVMAALSDDQPGMVGTEYTNSGLVAYLRSHGVDFISVEPGDVNVTKMLLEQQAHNKQWTRGGEAAGHHIDTEWLPSGDGVRTGALFAAWAAYNRVSFGEVHHDLPLWHEKAADIKLSNGDGVHILGHEAVQAAIAHVEEVYPGLARQVTRNSGTQKVLRLWAESELPGLADEIVQNLQTAVQTAQKDIRS